MTTLNLSDIQVNPLDLEECQNAMNDFDTTLDKDISYINVKRYLDILQKNKQKECPTVNIPKVDTIDSILEVITKSFEDASTFIETTFRDASEIQNKLNSNHVDQNNTNMPVHGISDDQTPEAGQTIETDGNSSIAIMEPHYINDSVKQQESPDHGLMNNSFECKLCKTMVVSKFVSYLARCNHFQMRSPDHQTKFICNICFLILPNNCSFVAHRMIHLQKSPRICPECGFEANTLVQFQKHLSYNCFHFARCMFSECFVPGCKSVIRHDFLYAHYMQAHTKQMFKCMQCPIACFTDAALQLHISQSHNGVSPTTGDTFYQCLPCSHKLVSKINILKHFKGHSVDSKPQLLYSCPGCNVTYQVLAYLKKHIVKCNPYTLSKYSKMCSQDFYFTNNPNVSAGKVIYDNVQKTCKLCNKSFMYAVNKEDDHTLPRECPLCKSRESFEVYRKIPNVKSDNPFIIIKKNIMGNDSNGTSSNETSEVLPDGAKNGSTWDSSIRTVQYTKIGTNRKKQFKAIEEATNNIQLPTNSDNSFSSPPKSKKRRRIGKRKNSEENCAFGAGVLISEPSKSDSFSCTKCPFDSLDKEAFREHIVSHRDNSGSYQCMECGSSFVVRNAFCSHLLIIHGVDDSDAYIEENDCFDKEVPQELDDKNSGRPVLENQCCICYEQFDNTIDHEKHFRVHGMAFILRKQRAKPNDNI